MRKLLGLLMLLSIIIPASATFAQDDDAPCTGVFLVDGHVRATVSPTGAAYGLVVNLSEDAVTLTGGSSENAEALEIHRMSVGDDDVMVMRPVEGGLEIPVGHAAELASGGFHMMMIGLSDMLMAGDEFDLSLSFADGSEFPLTLPIVDIDADTDHAEHSSNSDHHNHDAAEHGDAKAVAAMTECEGLTGVVVTPNADTEVVYDLTFVFEDSTEWTVSVPLVGMDEMDMEGM